MNADIFAIVTERISHELSGCTPIAAPIPPNSWLMLIGGVSYFHQPGSPLYRHLTEKRIHPSKSSDILWWFEQIDFAIFFQNYIDRSMENWLLIENILIHSTPIVSTLALHRQKSDDLTVSVSASLFTQNALPLDTLNMP